MNRLECVGRTSKQPSKQQDGVPVKAGILSSKSCPKGGTIMNKSALSKPMLLKRQPNPESEVKSPSVLPDRRQSKGNFIRSEAHALQRSADVTVHRKEKLQKPLINKEENAGNVVCLESECEPDVQKPPYTGAPQCTNGPHTSESESDSGEEEREEDEEPTDELHAPIELLAEFLKAVMGNNYTVAKKLCQMILIYEPENSEAKHFLPLIEQRLLTEAAQKNSSNEENTSDDSDGEGLDDNSDEEDDDEEDDEDDDSDDDDDDSSSCDSEGESTESDSSSSDREERDVSEC